MFVESDQLSALLTTHSAPPNVAVSRPYNSVLNVALKNTLSVFLIQVPSVKVLSQPFKYQLDAVNESSRLDVIVGFHWTISSLTARVNLIFCGVLSFIYPSTSKYLILLNV